MFTYPSVYPKPTCISTMASRLSPCLSRDNRHGRDMYFVRFNDATYLHAITQDKILCIRWQQNSWLSFISTFRHFSLNWYYITLPDIHPKVKYLSDISDSITNVARPYILPLLLLLPWYECNVYAMYVKLSMNRKKAYKIFYAHTNACVFFKEYPNQLNGKVKPTVT